MKIDGRELSNGKYQLNSLDGLRGAAVLLVFLSHTSNAGIHLLPHANFFAVGKSGVFLFFVLSSFLLTYPFVREGAGATASTFLQNYALRRFLRIYPLFGLYLLLALISTVVPWKQISPLLPAGIPFELDFAGFIEHLLLIDGKGVTWSIAVEFKYYFVLPIVGLSYSTLLKNRLLPAAALTMALILVAQLMWPASESVVNDKRLGPYLPIFLLGSFAALVYHNAEQMDVSRRRRIARAATAAGVIALAVLIFLIPSVAIQFLGSDTVFFKLKNFHTQFLLFGFLWSLVLLSCLLGTGVTRRLFEIPALRYMGFISFSMYLWHIVVIRLVEKIAGHGWFAGWIILALTVAISHATWLWIERPTSRLSIRRNANSDLSAPAPAR